jgi:MFS family permease
MIMDESLAALSTDKVPLLINRDYALLAVGQGISFTGDAFLATSAVLWIATQLAGGEAWAPAAVGALAILQTLPQIFVGPFAGVFVDRWAKKPLMLAMDVARAGLLLVLIAIASAGVQLPKAALLMALYATVFLITCCSQFFGPARLALVGEIVPDALRPRASGTAQMIAATAGILGPLLAAPLFFLIGPGGALGIDAASFLISFCAIFLIHAPSAARRSATGERLGFVVEFFEGLHVVRASRVLLTVLVTGVVFMLGGGALNTLSIFFMQQNLHASPAQFGLLGAVEGIGALAGGFFAGAIADRVGIGRLFGLSALLFGVVTLAYSRLTSLAPALALTFLIGLLFASAEVAEAPLILRSTPKEYVGRVAAIMFPSYSVASTISTLAAGWLASALLLDFHAPLFGVALGPVDTIFAGAGLLAASAGLFALIRLRGVRLQPATPTPSEPLVAGSEVSG